MPTGLSRFRLTGYPVSVTWMLRQHPLRITYRLIVLPKTDAGQL